jgi:hypothetical protein
LVLPELLSHGLLLSEGLSDSDSLLSEAWFSAQGVFHLDGEADSAGAVAFVEEVDPN